LWQSQFGFDVDQAHAWVNNEGSLGFLLDVVDKLSYVALDCFHTGFFVNGDIRQLCIDKPLVLDVWQDIHVSPDRSQWGFADPMRSYWFLLLRAYEHRELLFNPNSRFLDTHVAKFVAPLYRSGKISAATLRSWTDDDLIRFLEQRYAHHEISPRLVKPGSFNWKRFHSPEKRSQFLQTCGHAIDHCEDCTGFTTGYDWPVFTDKTFKHNAPLHSFLKPQLVDLLQNQSRMIEGYYVYWYIDH